MNIEHYYDKGKGSWALQAINVEGKNAGHIYYAKKGSEIRLCYIYVIEQGEGTGRGLLEKLIEVARECRAEEITGSFIPVPETSESARHLYETVGFVINPKTNKMYKRL